MRLTSNDAKSARIGVVHPTWFSDGSSFQAATTGPYSNQDRPYSDIELEFYAGDQILCDRILSPQRVFHGFEAPEGLSE